MKHRVCFIGICIFLLFSAACGLSRPVTRENSARPNIVLIMVDDMGYSDIGCYGGEIPTPNIDRLAENGLRFSQFYNTARCCPTRASLLTGLHPHQTGIGYMTSEEKSFDEGITGYRGYLNRRCVTIAEVLDTAGYHTYMTGKWHVGSVGKERWPLGRGFERYYGCIYGACHYFRPGEKRGLTLDNSRIEPEGDDFYITDAFTDYAIRFLREQKDDKPFFLYLAYNAPHWPLHAKPEDVAKFEGMYLKGWDAVRNERHARQLQMGLLSEKWPMSPRDDTVRAWDQVNAKNKKDLAHRMAVYAAQVYAIDVNIGRLAQTLKDLGKLDNTLILFLSDNGGCAEGGEFGGGKPEEVNNPDVEELFITYGKGWANASNTPFRRYKHFVHEGGISTPLIAHWPAGIRDQKGSITHASGYLPDIMSTCVELSGAMYPTNFRGEEIFPMQGKSLVPVFQTGTRDGHEYMFWEHESNCAVRRGSWKAIQKFGTDKWELYNVEADRTEQHDLAGEKPQLVEELADRWHQWAKANWVVPKPESKKNR